jgi:hypothetical protein
VGTFKHTHTCAHTHNPQVERVRVACYHPSCNSSCISGDPQLRAPLSTEADDDNDIASSLSSGLDGARASHHCCPLAPAFHPASSHLQRQGQVLGLSSSSLSFPLLSPCPHSCCPLILILLSPCSSCPHHRQCHPSHFCPIVLLSIVLFHLSSAFHGLFPLAVLICPVAPCFHPVSSCLQQWLGVLWWWWLLLWLAGCCLVVV